MSGQNVSTAVMARRVEPHSSLEDFPTQPWASRALIEHVIGPEVRDQSCWEPSCNRGHMAKPLAEYFAHVTATDIFDYGWPGHERTLDFLFPDPNPVGRDHDWIITNPPFRLASQFIARALDFRPRGGVAMFVRMGFLEGIGRYNGLFSQRPPSTIAQFVERVPLVKGRLTAKGSTATAYCWLVWKTGETGTPFQWIPPCRKRLERASDYEDGGR